MGSFPFASSSPDAPSQADAPWANVPSDSAQFISTGGRYRIAS